LPLITHALPWAGHSFVYLLFQEAYSLLFRAAASLEKKALAHRPRLEAVDPPEPPEPVFPAELLPPDALPPTELLEPPVLLPPAPPVRPVWLPESPPLLAAPPELLPPEPPKLARLPPAPAPPEVELAPPDPTELDVLEPPPPPLERLLLELIETPPVPPLDRLLLELMKPPLPCPPEETLDMLPPGPSPREFPPVEAAGPLLLLDLAQATARKQGSKANVTWEAWTNRRTCIGFSPDAIGFLEKKQPNTTDWEGYAIFRGHRGPGSSTPSAQLGQDALGQIPNLTGFRQTQQAERKTVAHEASPDGGEK